MLCLFCCLFAEHGVLERFARGTWHGASYHMALSCHCALFHLADVPLAAAVVLYGTTTFCLRSIRTLGGLPYLPAPPGMWRQRHSLVYSLFCLPLTFPLLRSLLGADDETNSAAALWAGSTLVALFRRASACNRWTASPG